MHLFLRLGMSLRGFWVLEGSCACGALECLRTVWAVYAALRS